MNEVFYRNSEIYNEMGVFSLTYNCLSPAMWTFYANHFKGICVGFNTANLFEDLKQSFAQVQYSDNPILHSFLKDMSNDRKNAMNNFFHKQMKWNHEEEIRYYTSDIVRESDRLMKIRPTSINEIVVGSNISVQSLEGIKDLCKVKYHNAIKLFQIETDYTWRSLEKKELLY